MLGRMGKKEEALLTLNNDDILYTESVTFLLHLTFLATFCCTVEVLCKREVSISHSVLKVP